VIVTESAESVATITISDVGTRNALDDSTRGELLRALQGATGDPNCAAIVLTGANDTFCAGGELKSMPREESKIRQRIGELHAIIRLIYAGPKPVVAAVDGAAYGSGLSLVAASDYVIATSRSRFGCTFGKVGLIADTGLLWTLPARVGERAARHVLLENRQFPAEEGLQLGLVDELAMPENLLVRARELAATFVDAAPLALARTKGLLASGSTLEQLLIDELDTQIELLGSDDFFEGRSAFFEKRSPRFRSDS
jgi:2-(1,2-epoxy-1,2-dihydrophenyl)acetyl-CoA isomerase